MIRIVFQRMFFILLISLLVSTISCKKDDIFTNDPVELSFSSDTLMFDTIFTTIGSSTQYLIVSNHEDKAVKVSKISLAGGVQSNFRINVDGISGVNHTDIEIPANDSIYIFVEVTVDPNNSNNPMIITDSIVFENNGKKQDVDLVAFGQDAYFIVPNKFVNGLPPYRIVSRENVDTTWTKIKPIVIYGYAVVDSASILTIEAGTKIYFHPNSGLWVYKGGAVKVNGTKNEPVVFQGDRTEDYYKNLPGQWDRIWINESDENSVFNYAIIKNGFIGIQAELLDENLGNSLILKNTRIENMSGAGLLSRAYKIQGENCIIANCQQYLLAMTMGGNYSFTHCTFANYWSYSIRKTPSVYANNYYQNPDYTIIPFNLVKADFINCIIYGNQEEELVLDNKTQGGNFNYSFDHLLVKTTLNTTSSNWISIKKNQNPMFKDYSKNDYHLLVNSPSISYGKPTTVANDLDEVLRDLLAPDLGAYEFITP